MSGYPIQASSKLKTVHHRPTVIVTTFPAVKVIKIMPVIKLEQIKNSISPQKLAQTSPEPATTFQDGIKQIKRDPDYENQSKVHQEVASALTAVIKTEPEDGNTKLDVKSTLPVHVETSERMKSEDKGTTQADSSLADEVTNSGEKFCISSVYSFKKTTQGKPYGCKICRKGYSTISAITKHMLVHENEETLKCKTCTKTFSSKLKLDKHEFMHTRNDSFTCSVCDKAFIKYSHLNAHFVKHKCSICNATIKNLFKLRAHMHTHNMSVCDICCKSYANKKRFVKHMQFHNENKIKKAQSNENTDDNLK